MAETFITRRVHLKLTTVKDTLVHDMMRLGEELMREARHLEKSQGFDYTVNSIGIVQNQGTRIDILCARYEDLRDIYENLVLDDKATERERDH